MPLTAEASIRYTVLPSAFLLFAIGWPVWRKPVRAARVVWGSQPVASTMSSRVAPVARCIKTMICVRFDPLRGSPAVEATCFPGSAPFLRFGFAAGFSSPSPLSSTPIAAAPAFVILSPIRLPSSSVVQSGWSRLTRTYAGRSARCLVPMPQARVRAGDYHRSESHMIPRTLKTALLAIGALASVPALSYAQASKGSTLPNQPGASEFAPGQRAKSGKSANTFAPGQKAKTEACRALSWGQ